MNIASRLDRLEEQLESRRPEVVEIVCDPRFFGENERNPLNGKPPEVVFKSIGGKVVFDSRYPDRPGEV